MADAPDSPFAASVSAPSPGNEQRGRRQGPRQRRDVFKRPHNTNHDSAMALFNEVVSPVASHAPSDEITNVAVMGELEVAAKLKEIMDKRMSPEKQYRMFRAEIWPSIEELRGQVSKPIYMAATQLLRNERDNMLRHGSWFHSVELAQTYSALGKYDLSIRNDLILNICASITQAKNRTHVRTQLREELIKMWMHVSQLKRPGEVDQELRFALPSVAEVIKDAQNTRWVEEDVAGPFNNSPTSRALASMFLQFPPPQARDILPALLATLTVMSDQRFAGAAYRIQIAPLLSLVRAVLSKHELTSDDIEFLFSQSSNLPTAKLGKLKEYTQGQWPMVTSMLTERAAHWQQTENPVSFGVAKFSTFHKQLRSAYKARHTGAVGHIWHNVMSSLEQNPELKQQLVNDPEYLDYWIFVWCAISRPTRLQETFDLMRSLDIEPTLRTYTGMMHGWKRCHDSSRIETLWEQLIQSGMKLDMAIWTERISALIVLGQPQKGLAALSEFLGTWKKAVKNGTEAQAVQPTIEVINAAFKGMLHVDTKAAHELLAWAGREGFEPNVRTYNILMRETLRSGTTEDVQELLRAMRSQGIDPDAATFTIILEEVISRMDDASAQEQVDAVHQVFADIEEAGLKANQETYGKMLYAVDSIANSSDDAMAAVQNHMRNAGFVVTPHMVTILIERALRRDPPDINKVRSLLKENKLSKVEQGDQTLWERVMSAHAISGETKEAMVIFENLAKAGRPVTSLPCLTELLQALLYQKDEASARSVVGVVLAHKLETNDTKAANERYWGHHFWHLAKRHGLMNNHAI
ncbi:hypothetical protein FZEAL_297 [Fusarium zealandicum]|uniref:Uncharacterized protein n=1 Tax=Fusarium zealandicum TaxID=1053134 RepID=A0A8H4UUY2_9HYPO|nr:hypothetical protein FZEAL_297 [Fusarium zealandicum]